MELNTVRFISCRQTRTCTCSRAAAICLDWFVLYKWWIHCKKWGRRQKSNLSFGSKAGLHVWVSTIVTVWSCSLMFVFPVSDCVLVFLIYVQFCFFFLPFLSFRLSAPLCICSPVFPSVCPPSIYCLCPTFHRLRHLLGFFCYFVWTVMIDFVNKACLLFCQSVIISVQHNY